MLEKFLVLLTFDESRRLEHAYGQLALMSALSYGEVRASQYVKQDILRHKPRNSVFVL